jgi:hypothetical protein
MANLGEVILRPKDLTRQSNPGVGQMFVFLGHASGGTETGLGEISDDSLLVGAFGYGKLTEYMGAAIRAGGTQYGKRLAGAGATTSAVTQTGSGPAVTLSGTPNDRFDGKIKIAKGGTNDSGNARFRVALDGATYGEEIDLPPRAPATMVGTVDLTTITLSSLNTKVIAWESEDGNPVSITLSTPASVAALISQINTGISADGSNTVAELRAGKYLVIKSGSVGPTSTLDGAAGDGMALVGLSPTAQETGESSTYEIPGTGLTATFANGTHELDTVHAFTTTAPRVSLSAYLAAIQDLRSPADGQRFAGFIICEEDWQDEHELYDYATSLASEVLGWETSEPARYNVIVYFGAKLGQGDQALRTKWQGVFSRKLSVAHGDGWADGTGYPVGKMRRSALFAQAIMMCALDESRSIGEMEAGPVPGFYMKSPSGTLARDEMTATTKMADRFNVLKRVNGAPHFMTGRTMADPSATPGFAELTWLRPFYHAMQRVHDVLFGKLEATYPLQPDKRLNAADAQALDDAVDGDLRTEILNPQPGRPRASAAFFKYDRSNLFGDTKAYTGKLHFQALGIAHSADVEARLVTEVSA